MNWLVSLKKYWTVSETHFIKHSLSSIALNSISKFKVRVLPSLTGYVDVHKKLPVHLTFAFAALIRFYKGTWKGESLPVQDSEDIVSFFKDFGHQMIKIK